MNERLAPILMQSAWRHGEMTPWGGEKLFGLLGKAAPGPRAGEALELSAIPGLESQNLAGQGLNQLIAQHGQRLVGKKVGQPFPLLLKLLDARERLSVQVHPDDSYARERHDKLGKNEAWVILQCEPGAELILGLVEGCTREELAAAAQAGPAIDGLLRRVPVKPGDAFYIPAGTVHAIGGGILLYEIQQSSDVTYRLYDWGRLDKQGQPRQMHLEDSLNVTDLNSRPVAAVPKLLNEDGTGQREKLLDSPYFEVERLQGCQEMQILPDEERFQVLTVLEAGALDWNCGMLSLKAGQTVLLPAEGFDVSFTGGSALICRPA